MDDDWDEDAFIESIKSELRSLWRNRHFSKGDEVTSDARITVPAGFLQPISQDHAALAVEWDEVVAPRRRRRRLLMELDDSSDDDGDGKSSPPCRDIFTNFPKKRRSRKNAIARVSTWKNISIPIWSEDSSTDGCSFDHGPCHGDSVQLTELKRLIVAEISGHALREERESAAANRIANGSSTHKLYLGPTLEDLVDLNKERKSRENGFGAKSKRKKLKSAESIRFEADSNKEDQEAAERTCKRRDLGATELLSLDAENYKLLEEKLKEAEQENVILINTIEEERSKSKQEKERLRKELEDASYTIGELVRKIRMLEGM